MPTLTDEQENERKQALAECAADAASFLPGTFGYHEALHTTSIIMETVGRHLLAHPSIIADPAAYGLADSAHDALFDLYQMLGAKHLAEDA